jgi:hypothetical protein
MYDFTASGFYVDRFANLSLFGNSSVANAQVYFCSPMIPLQMLSYSKLM